MEPNTWCNIKNKDVKLVYQLTFLEKLKFIKKRSYMINSVFYSFEKNVFSYQLNLMLTI